MIIFIIAGNFAKDLDTPAPLQFLYLKCHFSSHLNIFLPFFLKSDIEMTGECFCSELTVKIFEAIIKSKV